MKRILIFIGLSLLVGSNINSQTRDITNDELIKALELLGVEIHKYDIGEFDKKYNILLCFDEYKNGQLFKSDTLNFKFRNENIYSDSIKYENDVIHYSDTNKCNNQITYYYKKFIKELTVYSKIDKENLLINISLQGAEVQKNIGLKESQNNHFYKVFDYLDTKWRINEKVPLLICASTWIDENGTKRICGPDKMHESDRTDELLDNSLHYVIFSYLTGN